MLKLHEVMGGWGGEPKQRFICRGTVCGRNILAALRTVRLSLTRVRNQAKALEYSEKKGVFRTNLKQMFKCRATDLDTQLTTTQQRMTCALNNTRLQPEDYMVYVCIYVCIYIYICVCRYLAIFAVIL